MNYEEEFDGDYGYAEWHAMALHQYAEAYGEERPDHEYILSPYDTWLKNPFFTGTAGPHPDDWEKMAYYGLNEDGSHPDDDVEA
jgi:hypothetical protein